MLNLINDIYIYYIKIGVRWRIAAFLLGIIMGTVLLIKQYHSGIIKRRQIIVCSMLTIYLFLVLASTVLSRSAKPGYQYELELFWTYRNMLYEHEYGLIQEIVFNLLLLMPYGIFMPIALGKKKQNGINVIFTGFLLSSGIEILQLVLKRGLFEFDDILHNTAGIFLGYWLYRFLRGMGRNIRKCMK